MSLNSGKTPNVVFLDEVTSNVDSQGVSGIYNMICELNKEKKVFITTHDHDLIDYLNKFHQAIDSNPGSTNYIFENFHLPLNARIMI